MRIVAAALLGLLAVSAVAADDDERETIALINERLAEDRYYSTHGYSLAMPASCVLEIVPRGSAFENRKKRRVALHVLDRRNAERVKPRYRDRGAYEGTWIYLVGRLDRGKPRKGFPPTGDLDEKGFPKYDEEMLSYGIEFRLYDQDVARDVASAIVRLAADCDPGDI